MQGTWSPEQHAALIEKLNNELLADPRTAGKVFVIDPANIKTETQRAELSTQLLEAGSLHNNFLQKESGRNILAEYLSELQPGTNYKDDLPLSHRRYIGLAAAAEAGETINEAMAFFSRGTDRSFEGKVTPEFTHTFTIIHETAEAIRAGAHPYKETEMNLMLENRTSDATTALRWIQQGGDIDQLRVMAAARDLRTGFSPTKNGDTGLVFASNVSHDTGDAIWAVVARSEELKSQPGFYDMNLRELTEFAETNFSRPSMPTPEQFAEIKIAADNIRFAVGKNPGNQSDFQGPVTKTEQLLAERFNNSYWATFGEESPLAGNPRYGINMEHTHYAAWRVEPPSAYGGHDPAQGSFGSSVELGECGPLTNEFCAAQKADAPGNIVISVDPPAVPMTEPAALDPVMRSTAGMRP